MVSNISLAPYRIAHGVAFGPSALEDGVAFGLIDTETGDLMVMAGLTVGYDESYQAYYMWLAYFMIGDTGEGQFFSDYIPAYIFSMDKNGEVSCEMFAAEAKYEDGTPVTISAAHLEIFGVTEAGQLYFFQDEYRCGAMDRVKSEAAPAAKRVCPNCNAPVEAGMRFCIQCGTGL